MIINLNWSEFKECKDQSGNTIFYHVENEHCSNDPNVPDMNRYFMEMTLNADTLQCFITIEDPASSDQSDFETNYKPTAILMT